MSLVKTDEQRKCSITIGPMSVFFTNVNKAMGIPGHSHYAEVTIAYETLSAIGFPSFEETHNVIHESILERTKVIFKNATNEDITEILFDLVDCIEHPSITKWGGDYKLKSLELAVRGVPDKIGHSDGFTRYKMERIVTSERIGFFQDQPSA